MDCRHGRVLIYNKAVRDLLVWDPVRAPVELSGVDFAGAVVCAAAHDEHAHCHSSPFQIIFLENNVYDECLVSACVYSSETHVWSDWVSITTPAFVSRDSSALIGNSLCWTLNLVMSHLLEFELHSQTFNLINLPESVRKNYKSKIHVMQAEDGGVGFTGVNESRIDFWSRITDHEGVAGWTLFRVVDMGKLILSGVPAGDMLVWSAIVGIVENSDVFFLHSRSGIFMIDLKSRQLKKVPQASGSPIYPYTSFYTRGDDIIGIDVKHGTASSTKGGRRSSSRKLFRWRL